VTGPNIEESTVTVTSTPGDRAAGTTETDPAVLAERPDERAHHHDDMVETLPTEPSGPPVEGGSWQVARDLMNAYQLADPKVVTATYDESAPLAHRNMLLRISFKGLPLWVGVRVGQDEEETREVEGREVHVFGWSYDTLEGHFEEGRMHYELWKWLDSGEVEFHLRAASRPARDGLMPIRQNRKKSKEKWRKISVGIEEEWIERGKRKEIRSIRVK